VVNFQCRVDEAKPACAGGRFHPMANTLTDARQEEVWEALSDAFVDNAVDYGDMARQVADVPPEQLEEIFFNAVAPYCGLNLMMPIPPIWQGFRRKALAEGIRAMQRRNKNSLMARLRHKGWVALCRCCFRNEWKAITNALRHILLQKN
jgi:hypothetical protein